MAAGGAVRCGPADADTVSRLSDDLDGAPPWGAQSVPAPEPLQVGSCARKGEGGISADPLTRGKPLADRDRTRTLSGVAVIIALAEFSIPLRPGLWSESDRGGIRLHKTLYDVLQVLISTTDDLVDSDTEFKPVKEDWNQITFRSQHSLQYHRAASFWVRACWHHHRLCLIRSAISVPPYFII